MQNRGRKRERAAVVVSEQISDAVQQLERQRFDVRLHLSKKKSASSDWPGFTFASLLFTRLLRSLRVSAFSLQTVDRMSVSVFSQATLPHPTLSLSLQNPSSLTTAIKSSDIVLVSLGVKWNTGCYQTWNTLLHFQKLLERANESAQAKQTEDLVDMYSDEGGSMGAGSPTRSQSVGSPMKSPVGVADGELMSPTTTGVVVQSLGEELKYVVDELVRRKVSIKTVLLDQDEFVLLGRCIGMLNINVYH